MIEVNNHVRILTQPAGTINASARVVEVMEEGVLVSNLNMPFCGTYSRRYFSFKAVEKM